MKFFLLFVLVLGVSANVPAERNDVKGLGHPVSLGGGIPDIINGIIRKVVESMTAILPDPIILPQLNISLPFENLANGSFVLTDLIELGAKEFNLTVINTNVLQSTLNVVIDIPSIDVNTNYFTDLLIGTVLPLYGEGPANIRLKNLRFNLTSKYNLNIFKVQMQIQNTSLLISLGDAVFDVHGMINNEAFSLLVSQILDDTVDDFINKHSVLISKIISPVIEVVVNAILPGGGNKKKISESVFESDLPALQESQIMELRQLFVDELMKNPLISKYVSF